MKNNTRPQLTTKTKAEIFDKFYWLKKELTRFCGAHKLPSTGSKIELTKRVTTFLKTGKCPAPKKEKQKWAWDSEQAPLTPKTEVIHYKSDLITRAFFEKKIGPHFKFNADVLSWIKEKLAANQKLTYADIIAEWKKRDALKKDPHYRRPIPKQFQFNQFMQDWARANEQGDAKAAWKLVRSLPGEATYVRYRKIAIKLKGQ
jgi:hypothetical protein